MQVGSRIKVPLGRKMIRFDLACVETVSLLGKRRNASDIPVGNVGINDDRAAGAAVQTTHLDRSSLKCM